MASTESVEILQSTSEENQSLIDGPPKESTDTNCYHGMLQENYQSSPTSFVESSSSFKTASEADISELDDSNESFHNGQISTSFSQNNLLSSVNTENKTLYELDYKEDSIISSSMLQIEENGIIHVAISKETQQIISEKIGSTEEMQTATSEETGLNEEMQTAISEETVSNEIQTAISEETGLIEELQKAISEETGLFEEIQTAILEESVSNEIQMAISEENESNEIQMAISEENVSNEIQMVISEENVSNKEVQTNTSEENDKIHSTISENSESTERIQPVVTNNYVPQDLLFRYFSERDFNYMEKPFLGKKFEVSIKNNMTSPAKASNLSISEENKSTEVASLQLHGENRSRKIAIPELSEETISAEAIQSVTSETIKSTEVIQSDISKINKAISGEIRPTAAIHPTMVGDAGSSQAIQSTISKETSSDLSNKKDVLISASDTKKDQMTLNKALDSSSVKTSSNICTECDFQLLKPEESGTSEATRVVVKEIGISTPLTESEELKTETHFVITGSHCGGHVTVTPTSPTFEPIFPAFQIPPLDAPPKYTRTRSLQSLKPIDGQTNETSASKTSFSTFLSILMDWINTGFEQVFYKPNDSNFIDFIEEVEKKLLYGQDVVKQMSKRINILWKAAINLPDPPPYRQELKIPRNPQRENLIDAAIKVWRVITVLENEITDDYKKFVSMCLDALKLENDELDVEQIESLALNIISNSYVKASESFSTLVLEIDNFRNKIHEFCSEIERFL